MALNELARKLLFYNPNFNSGRNIGINLDGYGINSERFNRLFQLNFSFIDDDFLLGKSVCNILAGYGTEQFIVFTGSDLYGTGNIFQFLFKDFGLGFFAVFFKTTFSFLYLPPGADYPGCFAGQCHGG
jgi:hypothetical protein